MARGVARSTRGGQGRRQIRIGFDPYNVPRALNRINRLMTPAQRRGDFTDQRTRPQVIAETARRGTSGGGRTGNAGGGSTSGDPNKSRGSRRAASATAPTPAVRPRPSEARAARGQLIRQIANRRQNARRSQRTI
jgi:hypothetical protein